MSIVYSLYICSIHRLPFNNLNVTSLVTNTTKFSSKMGNFFLCFMSFSVECCNYYFQFFVVFFHCRNSFIYFGWFFYGCFTITVRKKEWWDDFGFWYVFFTKWTLWWRVEVYPTINAIFLGGKKVNETSLYSLRNENKKSYHGLWKVCPQAKAEIGNVEETKFSKQMVQLKVILK